MDPQQARSMALASAICGAISLVCLLMGCVIPFASQLGFILAIVALITGYLARRAPEAMDEQLGGEISTYTTVGLGTGCVTLGMWGAMMAMVFALLGLYVVGIIAAIVFG